MVTVSEQYQLEQEVKLYKEKAEKWEKLQNIFYEKNIRLTDRWLHDTVENWARIEQKIIQLKKELEIAKGTPNKTLLENMNLKQKLEKVKELAKVFQREEWGDCRYIRKMICGKLNAILASQEKE